MKVALCNHTIHVQALCNHTIHVQALCNHTIHVQALCNHTIHVQALCNHTIHVQALCNHTIHVQALCNHTIHVQALCNHTIHVQALCNHTIHVQAHNNFISLQEHEQLQQSILIAHRWLKQNASQENLAKMTSARDVTEHLHVTGTVASCRAGAHQTWRAPFRPRLVRWSETCCTC